MKRYKAFISYSHSDEVWAGRLHRRLEGYRPPRGLTLPDGSAPERLYPVYRDRDEMAASQSLPEVIEAALSASDWLIVLCSPASAQSAWVEQEIRLFAEMRGADRILPVILDGAPPGCFPPVLLEKMDEPLAPDFREGKDGFDDGALKIIAGIWGVSLGALKNREEARRRRRARLNTGLAAVFSALAVFAGFSEYRAAEQRERAEVEARMAEARSLAAVARATFEENPGETSVAAMIAVQSLALGATPEAGAILREALALAPLNAVDAPFRWRRPQIATSGDGRIAAFMSALSSNAAPAHSEIVRLSRDLREVERFAFNGLATPALSPNGSWLAVGGRVRRLFVRNLATNETALDQPVDSGLDVAFSEADGSLYAATQLGEFLRWTAGDAEAKSIAFAPTTGARLTQPRISLSTSGAWLLRSERGRNALVQPLDGSVARSAPFVRRYEKIGWREHAPDGAFALPNGERFITFDSFNTGALWDAETMKAVWSFDDASREWSSYNANAISRDGVLFARGREDGDLSVREMDDGRVIHRTSHGGVVRAVAFLEGPRRVVAAGEGGASIWRLRRDAQSVRCAAGADILSLAVEDDGAFLLGAADGRLVRCDGATGAILSERQFSAPIVSIAAAGAEIAISLKQSDRIDAWTELAIVDFETGVSSGRSLNEAFDQLRISQSGSRVAARSRLAGDVAIWNAASGDLIGRIAATGALLGLTPDGSRVLMDDRALAVFDVETGDRVAALGEAAGVSSLHAAPYEDLLITEGDAAGGRAHWAWSVETGEVSWRGPDDAVLAPGARAYARYSEVDAVWRVTDRRTGAEIGAAPFPGQVWGAALSPDGGSLTATRRLLDERGVQGFETALWDVRAGRAIWRRKTGSANTAPPKVIGLSDDRAALTFSQRDETGKMTGGVEVFDWSSGATIASIPWSGVNAPTIAADPTRGLAALSTDAGTVLISLADGAILWSAPSYFDRGLAFSPDGMTVIAAWAESDGDVVSALSSDNGAVLWRAPTRERLQDVTVTSAGQRVVAALASDGWNGLRIWRLADGALMRELRLDAAPRLLHPLRDPDQVVVKDAAGVARLLDLVKGEEIRRFAMSTRADQGVFSQDGERAVTAAGARLRYWNAATGVEIDAMQAGGRVSALAMSPDGAEVAFIADGKRTADRGDEPERIYIWRPDAGDRVDAITVDDPRRLAFDPAGNVLTISAGDDRVYVIDAKSLAPRFTVAPLKNGTFSPSSSVAQLFTRDGEHLLLRETGSYGQGNTTERRVALRVFNLASGAEGARLDADINTLSLAATPKGFYYADPSGQARHVDISEQPLDRRLEDGAADKAQAIPGGDLILASGYWRSDALIDIRTGSRIGLTEASDQRHTLDSAVDPSGRYVALSRVHLGGDDGPLYDIQVFDATTGTRLAQTHPSSREMSHIEFAEGGDTVIAAQHPENTLITSADDEGRLYLWRWRAGTISPLIDDNLVADFSVSADGGWLATSEGGRSRDTGAEFGRVQTRVIRLGDEETIAVWPHEHYAPNLALSADGERIGVFSAASPTSGDIRNVLGDDKRSLTITLDDAAFYGRPLGFLDNGETFVLGERSGARVYDLTSGAVQRFRTPWRARTYALSPDGAFIAIGGDEDVSLWNMTTRDRVAQLKVPHLRSIIFAGADGRDLIALTDKGVLRLVWETDALVDLACKIYRHDAWEAGRKRITATDAPSLCAAAEQ